ncbi:DUF1837 domain-containing protein [Weissella confusa]|uniref:HamA C-terminal domain-containing protein n=1 Tax=Weissella confusa TaxID=1583 RepID=UPI0021BE5BF5|nr:DUF1837 domain-containing protein [Weissella confusa]MCT8392974.1 DUF1837 domain-containing protein [Weissella confusa]
MDHNFENLFHEIESENDSIHLYHLRYNLNDDGESRPVTDQLVNVLFNNIAEFGFGPAYYEKILQDSKPLELIVQAAKKLYEIEGVQEVSNLVDLNKLNELDEQKERNPYLTRGEFGELLTYMFLTNIFNAPQLFSKIYFKDSNGVPAHGFDAVHVNLETEQLWVGESKLYTNDLQAIDALSKDVMEHFNTKFFETEFGIIQNRLADTYVRNHFTPEKLEYFQELTNPTTLNFSDLLNSMNLVLFAAFDINAPFDDDDDLHEIILERSSTLVERLAKNISENSWSQLIQYHVVLLPVESKNELILELHRRLSLFQMM